MIRFLTTAGNTVTINRYLASWGRGMLPRILPSTYEQMLTSGEMEPGLYVFADIELLDDASRGEVAARWRALAARDGSRLLNHPERSMRRFELLTSDRVEGARRFAVQRVASDERPRRFPVFLRHENEHTGVLSELIEDATGLEQALGRISAADAGASEWLAVEFVDTSDDAGIFRKYSAFYIDDEVIPRHLLFSRNWELKVADLRDRRFLEEEHGYIEDNPHRGALERIFRQASIDYGRIDYALKDGEICIWEINTNPVILTPAMRGDPLRRELHDRFAARISRAFRRLDARYGRPATARNRLGQLRHLPKVVRETASGQRAVSWSRRLRGLPQDPH